MCIFTLNKKKKPLGFWTVENEAWSGTGTWTGICSAWFNIMLKMVQEVCWVHPFSQSKRHAPKMPTFKLKNCFPSLLWVKNQAKNWCQTSYTCIFFCKIWLFKVEVTDLLYWLTLAFSGHLRNSNFLVCIKPGNRKRLAWVFLAATVEVLY